MPWSRARIDEALAKLEERMPTLLAENPEDEHFWPAFAGEADCISENVGAEDVEHVRARLDCILGSLGLIPSDNEGEPCSDDQAPND